MSAEQLDLIWQSYAAAAPERRQTVIRTLVTELKRALAEGRERQAASVLAQSITPDLDYTAAQSLHRIYRQLREREVLQPNLKIAVLGGFTTAQLTAMTELSLLAAGLCAEVYEADYGLFRQEVIDEGSELYAFQPTVTLLATSWRDLGHKPELASSPQAVQQLVDAEVHDWQVLWSTLDHRLGCQIIQNNFDPPPCRPLANHERRHAASWHSYIARVNEALLSAASPQVLIHDVDHLSASWGRWRWGDERFYHHAKIPCSPECLVDYGHSIASLVAAAQGKSKKCLVLDLDNTLWGGVIGDDGLGGIRLGQGDAVGEAFVSFQRYIKSLQQRGVILAVCSKNEEAVAKEVFTQHSEMVLRLEDISCFIANWNDKASNLREIAQRLNIGVDSLVFADDNPAERAIVRQYASEVTIPELPEDPAGYIEAIDRGRWFQTVSIGREDYQRTDYYRANSERMAIAAEATDMDAFLSSLEMVADIGPVSDLTLERTVQLINKSNQFNLTTMRRTAAEVAALVADPNWLTCTVSLSDRFGDNGLISVVLAEQTGSALRIDTWLMSCRVLKRGVERHVLNYLASEAQRRGLACIEGAYIPTRKNIIVKDHYADLGFEMVREHDGHSWWRLATGAGWQNLPAHIQEKAA